MLMASSSFFSGLQWIFGFLFFFFSSSPPSVPDPHCLFGSPNPNLKPNPNPNPKAPPPRPPPLLTDNVYRTAYHFQPPRNWMNDPNAPMYYNGIYHLFYQYNPNGSLWSHIMFWGHSVSTDLIHWTALDIALSPSIPSDINGCWSGSVTFLPGNRPVILYTGLDAQCRQVQNVAYPTNISDPFLREWMKPGYNPVIEPFDARVAHLIRDPTAGWLEPDGLWRTVIGTVTGQDAVGHAILYRSRDFVNWVRAENPFHSTNGSGLWECLDFYPLEVPGSGGTGRRTKYVLKVSFYDTQHDHYTLGRSDAERDVFIGDDASSNDYRMWPTIDYGRFYASKTFFDVAKQRRILWAWSNESDSTTTDTAKGWAGIQTVPRVVSLDTAGRRLVQWPVEEIESLRRDRINLQDVELKKGSLVEIKGLLASQADVEVEFELPSLIGAEPFDTSRSVDPAELCREKGADVDGRIGPFGLLVLASDNLEEHTEVYFRVFEAEGRSNVVLMCTDQRRSSLITDFYKPVYGGFVDIDIMEDRKISLRTLIDHSVVESFGGGGRTCITSRVYPTLLQKGNAHLYAFNNGTETVKISELKAWNMAHARIN